MISILLNGLYLLFLAIVSPWIVWRYWTQGRFRRGWTEKTTGLHHSPYPAQNVVWLHAVSVGEVQVIRTLVEKFEAERPDWKLAISVTTDSGMDLAQKIFSKHFVFFAPFDFSWAVKRTFRTLHPKLMLLAELELWPNWLLEAERIGCPVAILNGRLSERSYLGYARFGYLVRACFRTIDWVGAQSETYALRFQKLGVEASRIAVTGNVKFDGASGNRMANEVIERRQILGLSHSKPPITFLAGSTQSPEESIVLKAFSELVDRFPHFKLILVPRHPERFQEVADLIQSTGLRWSRRSESQVTVSDPNWQVFLGDSIGELRWWWGLADIGFVGGSFGDRGGQNMIEPCAYGVATCFGPNTRNFADIVKLLLDENACVELQNPDELRPWLETQLTDRQRSQEMAAKAMSVCRQHRGAIERTWTQIERFCQP